MTRADCRALHRGVRGKGLKLNTVKGIVRTLSTVLSQAVEDEKLPANPALRIGRYLRRGDEPKPEIQPLTRAEARSSWPSRRQHFPRWFRGCSRAAHRPPPGRAARAPVGRHRLAWSVPLVQRNIVRGVLTSPKSHQRRRVDMSAQLDGGAARLASPAAGAVR